MPLPQFTATPEPGYTVHWGSQALRFVREERGQLFKTVYLKLIWAGACKDCGGEFEQSTSYAPRRFASRCKTCDPKGEKDAADRRAYVEGRKPANRPPLASRIEGAALEGGRLVGFIVEPGAEPYEVVWAPGVVYEPPALLAALQAEFDRLTAAEALL